MAAPCRTVHSLMASNVLVSKHVAEAINKAFQQSSFVVLDQNSTCPSSMDKRRKLAKILVLQKINKIIQPDLKI